MIIIDPLFFIRLFIKSFVYFPLCVISVMLLLMFYSCFYSFCTNRLNLSNHTGSFHWSLSCFVLPIVPEWNTSPLFQNWNQICFTSLIHFWRLCSFFQHNRTPSPSLLCVCAPVCVCACVCVVREYQRGRESRYPTAFAKSIWLHTEVHLLNL